MIWWQELSKVEGLSWQYSLTTVMYNLEDFFHTCPPAHLSFRPAGTSTAKGSNSGQTGPIDKGNMFFGFYFCLPLCVKRVLSEKSHRGSVKPWLPTGMKICERCSALAWLNTERCQSPAPMIKIGSSPLDLRYLPFFGRDKTTLMRPAVWAARLVPWLQFNRCIVNVLGASIPV